MKVILIKFNSPQDVGVEFEPKEVQKDACFRIVRFTSEPGALWAYANTPCTWSTLKDENDDLQAFIDEAWERIQSEDYEWLEQNFVLFMNIINYIKCLFHTHQYVYQKTIYQSVKEADFSGFGYNTWTEVYNVYRCKKCGKLIRKLIKII